MTKTFTTALLIAAAVGALASPASFASAPGVSSAAKASRANPWDAVGLATRPAAEGVLYMAYSQPVAPRVEASVDLNTRMLRNPWLALHFPVRPVSTAMAGTSNLL
jgi:hypothetical protein